MKRIAAHPIVAFVVLTYAFSYLLGAPFLIAVQAWLPRAPELVKLYLGRSLVVFGPAVAAVLVTSATDGRAGVLDLLRRLRFGRADLLWGLVLPLLALGVTMAAYLLAGVSPTVLGGAVVRSWPLLLVHCLLQTLVIGVGEEIGWRGWLLPALLRRHSRLAASTLLAAAWGLWHVPILLSGVRAAGVFLIGVYALTLLLTALWSRTHGNLAVLALAHGSFNAPLVFFEGVQGPNLDRAAWEWTVFLYVAGALLLVAFSDFRASKAGKAAEPIHAP